MSQQKDYRNDPGFLGDLWDNTKSLMFGGATPVKYTALAVGGLWLTGGLLSTSLGTSILPGSGSDWEWMNNLFFGGENAIEIYESTSLGLSMIPMGPIACGIMGLAAVSSIPRAIKKYRDYKHQYKKSRLAVRSRSIDLMEECLKSNSKYQQIKKQFDKQEKEFQELFSEELEEKKGKWAEQDKKGAVRQLIDKTLTGIPVVGGMLAVGVDKAVEAVKSLFLPSSADRIRNENNRFKIGFFDRLERLQNEFLDSLSQEEKQVVMQEFYTKQQQVNWKAVKENAFKMAQNVKVPKNGRSLKEFESEIQELESKSAIPSYGKTSKEVSPDVENKKISIKDPEKLLSQSRQYKKKKDDKNYALAYQKKKDQNVA